MDGFTCGNEDLDKWLKTAAIICDRKRVSRTWVWADDAHVVWAYFALGADKVQRADVPLTVGRGDPNEIPAILLQKFARHEALKGKGLGPHLLLDALSRAVSAGEIVAARYIVVDAIDDKALDFYQRHGFIPLPPPSALRLVMKCSDAAASLEAGGWGAH